VKVAASGGSKQDHVDPTGKAFGQGGAEKGFGHVPFPRDEYTAEKRTLYASLDLAQIRGYGLEKDATQMLILLALFKLRSFVDSPMRLRTACSFVKGGGDITSTSVTGFKLPSIEDLRNSLTTLIGTLARAKAFAGERGVTTVTFTTQAS
jgi:CRISPR-associated protein Csb1